ncbi:hypothetical protein [Microbacterium sp. NPDC079208]|uniref:zinc finger domain-containing protein n=1 Tax=Microbacterium sp. NPDC079208 TaxID=3154652 RepID=UPI00344F5304
MSATAVRELSVAEVRVRVLSCTTCGVGPGHECRTSEGVLGWLGVHPERVVEALVRGSEVDERLFWTAETSRDPGVIAAAARARLDRANRIIAAVASAGGAS